MKLKMLFASLALLCGQALATPFTWTDTHNPNPDVYVTPFNSYTFTFDISDGTNGFCPFTDTVTDYTVRVNLYDDQDHWLLPFEIALVNMPGLFGTIAFSNLGVPSRVANPSSASCS